MKKSELIKDQAFANGKWIHATGKRQFEVTNPANGEVIGSVADLSREEVSSVIDDAEKAWSSYRSKTAKERSVLLRNWFNLIIEHKRELAEIMTMESGKVMSESLGEVNYGAAFVEWFSEEARRSYGDVIPSHTSDRRLVVIKQPVGVAAAITPWNFPLAMITRKVAPALAAGCPVIIKPPEETPLTALALAVLAEKAGFPPGIYNTITTTDSSGVGKELCENPKVRKLSFTGSTEVGKILMEQCAGTLKKLSLELGGNAPFIVFEDADIDAAVQGAVTAKYRHNGQTCVCVNRFLIHEAVYDEFLEKFTHAVKNLKRGDVTEEGVEIGPLISNSGLEKVEDHIADAVSKGGRVVAGGEPYEGLFFKPTVIADATPDMKIARQEVFGPVAPLFKFKTDEEAVEMANDTEFGLAAYFYSNSVKRCWRVAEALEYGMVGVNEGLISTEVAPFGGIKESGFGREGSKYGMDDYTVLKYMCFGNV